MLTAQNCQFLGGYVPHLQELNNPRSIIRRMEVFKAALNKDVKVPAFQVNPQLNDSNERKRKSNSITEPVQPKMANLSIQPSNNAGTGNNNLSSSTLTANIPLPNGTSIINGVSRQIIIQPVGLAC